MALQSGLPIDVGDGEMLVRFAWQSNQFKRTVAKDALFKPHRGETSVFRRDRTPREGLLVSARDYERASGNAVRAIAFVRAGVPRRIGLAVVADEPPSHHAAVRGWTTDGDEARAHNDALAKQIAAEAIVEVFVDRG